MGYALSMPTGLMRVGGGGVASAWATITTATANVALGTLTTPNYKIPLSFAYVDLVFQGRRDSSGAANWFDASAGGHLGMLKGGGTTFDCGLIHANAFYVPASEFIGGEYRLCGTIDIASHLEPNTAYTCQLMHTKAVGDNLILYGCTFELNLFFGM